MSFIDWEIKEIFEGISKKFSSPYLGCARYSCCALIVFDDLFFISFCANKEQLMIFLK